MPREPGAPAQPPREDLPVWRYVLFLAVALFILTVWTRYAGQPVVQEVSYSRFKAMVDEGRLERVTFVGQEITGRLAGEPEEAEADARKEADKTAAPDIPTRVRTYMPTGDDPKLMDRLERNNVEVYARDPAPAWWQQILVGVLPWVLLIGLLFWFSYRMQKRMMGGGAPGGGGGMFGVGKSKARRIEPESVETRFDDVAGLEHAKEDLREITDYLSKPDRYRRLGAHIPKGVLLMGPPGTGKTLAARAVAGEAGVPFFSIGGSEFIEMFVGVGAARVRDMFSAAKREAPALVFIDELDSIGRVRGTGLGGGHDEREQTLNQILSELDGFSPMETVVVMAATNRPDVLDPALLRPGRFDRKITLDLPRKQARAAILKVHLRQVPLDDDVDLETLAERTVGFSGADLANLANEAALLAGREERDRVDMACFNRARDKIVLGAERENLMTDEEKEVVAYHESGHALMARLLEHADPLDRVSIIPRGRALGATEQTSEEERYNLRASYLLDRIGVMLGGRMAEKVVFGEVSTGAESDLKQATRLARRMVSHWGMSEKLGPAAFRQGEEHPFIGREMAQEKDFSEQTAELIDAEIRRILTERERAVGELLEKHRNELEKLARALLREETLDADQVERLLRKAA